MPIHMRMPKLCPLCGPMWSVCWLVFHRVHSSYYWMCISVAGTIFLGLIGVAFYVRSYQLFEELGHWEYKNHTSGKFDIDFDAMIEKMNVRYTATAYNCWIAAAMYVITFVLVFWQHHYNPPSGV